MSKSTVKVVEIDTNPAVKSIKDLRKELMEYKNQMANLEEGSDAFLEVAAKAGEVKHQLDEINQQIKGSSSDFGDLVGNVTTLAAGITGAFQAVAGGLQAIGFESEALDKTIAKMQGLMAVTQGLSAIEDGKDAFKRLTKQMGEAGVLLDKLGDSVGTFIGKLGKIAAPIAIVTALGVAFVKLKEKIDGTATALKNREIAQKNFNTELEREVEIRKRAGYEEEELIQFEINKLEIRNKQLEQTNSELKAQNDAVSQNAQAAQNAAAAFGGLVAAQAAYNGVEQSSNVNVSANTKLIKENTQEINDNATAIENLKNQLDIIEQARKLSAQRTPKTEPTESTELNPFEGIVDITDEITKKLQDKYDIQLEQLKRSNKEKEEYLTAEIEIEKNRLSLYTEGSLEYEKQLTHIFNLENELKELTETSTEVVRKKTEEVRDMGNAIFENLKSTVDMFADSSLGISSGWIESLNQFQTVFTMTMDTVEKKGKATWIDYGNIATTALSGIGSVLNTLSQEQDASTEEGFKKTKQFQIAATILNMLSGIMNAWTSAMSPSNAWMTVAGQIAMGTAMSGMVAGIGAAQIEKIKNATMSSANPNTNINAKSVNSMIMPPVQYSNAVQGANTENAIKDTKVYVTETDLVDTIGRVKVQETENVY